jgi:hypothetical protein
MGSSSNSARSLKGQSAAAVALWFHPRLLFFEPMIGGVMTSLTGSKGSISTIA